MVARCFAVSAICFMSLIAATAPAQTFELTWHATGSGGSASAAGNFTLTSTIGQPEASPAGALTSGTYSLTGGFWSILLPYCTVFIAADFDQDCRVDAVDVSAFADCASGAAIPPAPECKRMDLDDDADVDLDDFGLLQRCYSGAVAQVDPNCGD